MNKDTIPHNHEIFRSMDNPDCNSWIPCWTFPYVVHCRGKAVTKAVLLSHGIWKVNLYSNVFHFYNFCKWKRGFSRISRSGQGQIQIPLVLHSNIKNSQSLRLFHVLDLLLSLNTTKTSLDILDPYIYCWPPCMYQFDIWRSYNSCNSVASFCIWSNYQLWLYLIPPCLFVVPVLSWLCCSPRCPHPPLYKTCIELGYQSWMSNFILE